jgi:hypothetical protein
MSLSADAEIAANFRQFNFRGSATKGRATGRLTVKLPIFQILI